MSGQNRTADLLKYRLLQKAAPDASEFHMEGWTVNADPRVWGGWGLQRFLEVAWSRALRGASRGGRGVGGGRASRARREAQEADRVGWWWAGAGGHPSQAAGALMHPLRV